MGEGETGMSSRLCIPNPWIKPDGQIATKNYRAKRTSITKTKLGHEVAKVIRTYLDDLKVSYRYTAQYIELSLSPFSTPDPHTIFPSRICSSSGSFKSRRHRGNRRSGIRSYQVLPVLSLSVYPLATIQSIRTSPRLCNFQLSAHVHVSYY